MLGASEACSCDPALTPGARAATSGPSSGRSGGAKGPGRTLARRGNAQGCNQAAGGIRGIAGLPTVCDSPALCNRYLLHISWSEPDS